MPPLFIVLAIAWSFLYWVVGGVVFSIIAMLRFGRIRRVRFGCFFSVTAVGVGVLSAWSGLQLSARQIAQCPSMETDRFGRFVEQFACGIVGIFGSFLGGFLFLMLIGTGLLLLSRMTNKSWIENQKPSV